MVGCACGTVVVGAEAGATVVGVAAATGACELDDDGAPLTDFANACERVWCVEVFAALDAARVVVVVGGVGADPSRDDDAAVVGVVVTDAEADALPAKWYTNNAEERPAPTKIVWVSWRNRLKRRRRRFGSEARGDLISTRFRS